MPQNTIKTAESAPNHSSMPKDKEIHYKAKQKQHALPPAHGDGIMDWRRDAGTEKVDCVKTGDEGPVIGGEWLRKLCEKDWEDPVCGGSKREASVPFTAISSQKTRRPGNMLRGLESENWVRGWGLGCSVLGDRNMCS